MKEVNPEHLLMLVALLFMIYFFTNLKETFDQLKSAPSRDCSRREINAAYNNYIFGRLF